MIKEIFKDIEGYENLYQISNHGRVKSLGNDKTRKEKILKLTKYNNGYLMVILSKQGKVKHFLVHRLVSEAFIPNPDNLSCVNHKDENKMNNTIQNLEWCDYKYNNNYGTRTEKTSKKVLCVETGVVYPSVKEAKEKTKLHSIDAVCRGMRKTCGNFHWKYVN